MIISEWLKHLRTRHIELFLEGEQLRFRAPQGALTPELRVELKGRKAEILRFLRRVDKVAAATERVIERAPRHQSLPLSFGQARLWFHDQLVPGSAIYIIPTSIRFRGPLLLDALGETFREIIRRHEVLRTRFPALNGEPVQRVDASSSLPFPLIDLQDVTDPTGEADRLAHREVRRPFDLAQGPLLRLVLMRFSANHHRLLLMMHHIVADGWSMGVMLREFVMLYRSFLQGRPSPLPDLPIQYADYAWWEHRQHQAGAGREGLAFWKATLANSPELNLPLDYPRLGVQGFSGSWKSVQVSEAVAAKLDVLARSEGATWFMVSSALFLIVLRHWSGQEDLVVGTDIANREQPETTGMIGFLVNQLALRFDLSDNPTFLVLLARIRQVVGQASSHGSVPFDRVVKAVQSDRDLERTPLFQVKIVHQPPFEPMSLPGLTLQPESLDHGTAKFDLLLNISQWQAQRSWTLEYNKDLFAARSMDRMMAHLQTVLAAVAADPELGPRDLSTLLAASDREQQKAHQIKRRQGRRTSFRQTTLKTVKIAP